MNPNSQTDQILYETVNHEMQDWGDKVIERLETIGAPATTVNDIATLLLSLEQDLASAYHASMESRKRREAMPVVPLAIPEYRAPEGNVTISIDSRGAVFWAGEGYYSYMRATCELKAVTAPAALELIKRELEK